MSNHPLLLIFLIIVACIFIYAMVWVGIVIHGIIYDYTHPVETQLKWQDEQDQRVVDMYNHRNYDKEPMTLEQYKRLDDLNDSYMNW